MHTFDFVHQPLPHNESIHDEVRRFAVPGGWLYQIRLDKTWSQPVYVPGSRSA